MSTSAPVGRALAARLRVPYVDGDDLHPQANIAKMASGVPLQDDDRWPWLDAVGERLSAGPVVVACSALRRAYRDVLRRHAPSLRIVFLDADRDVLVPRMMRPGHFMPSTLLESQLSALERPEADEDAIRLDAVSTPSVLVDAALRALGRPGAGGLLVGTYTERLPHVDGRAPGIMGLSSLGPGTVGDLRARVRNPSWLAVSPGGDRVYAVSEVADGEVVAFRRDSATGVLEEYGRTSTGGAEPAHLLLHPRGDLLVVCNYGGGSVAWIGVTDEKLVLQAVTSHADLVEPGGGERQTAAHPHQAVIDPRTGRILVSDLGADSVVVYDLDSGGPRRVTEENLRLPRGTGPRHMAFDPAGDRLAVLNELASTVTLCVRRGTGFAPVSGLDLRPDEWRGRCAAAAIVWHPDGTTLWATLRGPDTVVVIDAREERLLLSSSFHGGGREPRELIYWEGVLVVAHQDDDTIGVFEITDGGHGIPQYEIGVPTPVCLVPLPG
jgi:6-phosphogluconolactonase